MPTRIPVDVQRQLPVKCQGGCGGPRKRCRQVNIMDMKTGEFSTAIYWLCYNCRRAWNKRPGPKQWRYA